MKIANKEYFEIAKIFAKQAVRHGDSYRLKLAREFVKLAYGL